MKSRKRLKGEAAKQLDHRTRYEITQKTSRRGLEA